MSTSQEDEEFWLETVKDVKRKTSTDIVSDKSIKISVKKHFFVSEVEKQTYFPKKIENSEFNGIDKSTLKKFRREEFQVESTLDLHGKTEDEAFQLVNKFITHCYTLGKRCIIIITGKGLNIHKNEDLFANKGILRKSVPQWLDLPNLRSMILIYKNPSEKLGGNGALYILLRRNKKLI